jgi:hypothetical protein
MKNSIGIFAVLLLLAAGQSFGQTTPVADGRQQAQRARIRQGVASGELNRAETAKLRSEQRHIRRSERRMKADGKVTARERARLQHKQNRAGRDISRQKHDGQGRAN